MNQAVAQSAYELSRLDAFSSNSTIDMTCFPPPNPGGEPGIGSAPPCLLPTNLDPSVVAPDPSGQLALKEMPNGETKITIDLEGLDEDMVITAWTSYFFPGGPVAPHPIFDPIGPGLPPIAGVSAPMAPTTAAFTEGMAPEPNQFDIKSNGKSKLTIFLDYDPLLPGQGPLRNDMVTTNQALAPAGDDAEQPLCCPAGVPAPSYQPVGSSFLRAFDPATGFQRLDANGRPVLIRSPRAVDFIAIVVHSDKTTHGINPGIPILPIPGLSATTGDHYLLGIFDLRALHPSSGNQPAQFIPSEALSDEGYELSSVYPNPFNPTTSFQLRVAETQHVKIEVYDMLGRFVARLHDGELTPGQGHLFSFDAANLASGKYLLRATGEKFISNQNITLLK
ncbi:MAG: T9SS type A sorting domain-containing protein [Rhodothermales bacterium]